MTQRTDAGPRPISTWRAESRFADLLAARDVRGRAGLPSVTIGYGPGTVAAARPTKLLTIIEENHGQAAALAGMPYLASLAAAYGHTTRYRAVAHPSLPNYLALAGGSTFGVTDDAPPPLHHVPGRSVFDQALATGHTATVYAESMPHNCDRTSAGRYAVKHNPWAYFSEPAEQANCLRFDRPAGTPTAGALHDDVTAGTLPTIGLIIPDLCNDAHDCPLSTADTWLRGWLPTVLRGPDYRSGRLAVVITFDEAEGPGPNTVLTTVIAPASHRITSDAPYTHYSWTRYADQLTGAPPLNDAASPSVTSLGPAFRLG